MTETPGTPFRLHSMKFTHDIHIFIAWNFIMSRSFSTLSLSTVLCIALTACTTLPKAETLMTGISATDVSKPFPDGQLRAETDPVCVNFYKNARTYIAEANKPNPGGQILKSVGIGVLASVVTGGIAGSGINSTIGQIAAQQAASTAVYQGSNLALAGIKKNSGASAKLTAAAEELHCPLTLA